jgi:probable nitrogen fixation protein
MTATNNSVNGTTPSDVLSSPFVKALIQQIRGQDSYGFYRSWTDELILKPFIVTKQKKREIPVDGEVDQATQARILTFYRSIAARVEQETGLLSQVVIDVNHEGFGWALVFAGRLMLVCKSLRDVHRFGFESLEKLSEEGEKLVEKAIDLAKRFPEVGNL